MTILEYQWTDIIVPYWKGLVKFANDRGIPQTGASNCTATKRLQSGELQAAARRGGEGSASIYEPEHQCGWAPIRWQALRQLCRLPFTMCMRRHAHWHLRCVVDGLLDARSSEPSLRAQLEYVTLGYGHDALWWKQFCLELANAPATMTCFSIEHETRR